MKIFISYRRDDSADVTGRIYENLIPPLGPFAPEDVFIDVDSMPLGVNFKDYLEMQVAQCALCLVVIGPQWTAIADERGTPRLHDPRDFVRIEVETALTRKIPVIPLLVMNARMPTAAELPASLSSLTFQNGTVIRRNPDFKADIGRVIKAMHGWLNTSPVAPVSAPPPRIEVVPGTIRTDAHGIEQVYVPAGTFIMGSDPKRDPQAQLDEQPAHEVHITRPFWIDHFPVTNAAFAAFAKDGYRNQKLWTPEGWAWREKEKISAPKDYDGFGDPKQPRVGISWYEAAAYAIWRGARLPTEAEWEYAARGPKSSIYPWGDQYELGRANIDESDIGGKYLQRTSAVDAYPIGRSWIGAYDMAGNVWEWVADGYSADFYANRPSPDIDPFNECTSSSNSSGLRGGSWYFNALIARAAARSPADPHYRYNGVGLRLVASVPS